MADTKVKLSGIMLDNPVIPASGTFGYGAEMAELYDINILGSLVFKGTTLKSRQGNPQPRIAECSCGMINSVGLENPGLEAVCDRELKNLANIYKKPVIANISGFSVEEYVTCARAMEEQEQVGIIEVNISCPNVHNGGMAFGTDPEQAALITSEVKKVTTKPVYMKLSPNVTDIALIAKACYAAGADGLSLINTLMGMRIDIKKRKSIIANGTGGFSGPAIFPVALAMVYNTAKAVDIPIIGIGGISSAEDVLEMIMAGAHAVEIGAANLTDPYICRDIIKRLPELMDELGIADLDQIRGTVK